jgi:hypothetical protein
MSVLLPRHRRAAASFLALVLSAALLRAQTTAVPAGAPPSPSLNLTINLINRLVQRGALTQADADELIRMAEDDTRRAQAMAGGAGGAAGGAGSPNPLAQSAAGSAAAVTSAPGSSQTSAAVAPTPPAIPDGTVRVTYVPEIVKRQIRDELRQDVLAQARAEGWAAPRILPEWVTRFKIFGDFRLRYEGLFYPKGNDNTGAFPNFNAINTGTPFDVAGSTFSPQINVDQDRTRIRLRARLGFEADMGDGFSSGFRIATGDSSSPVSANQSLGTTNGEFSKYALWLDRAFVNYRVSNGPVDSDWVLSLGRFDDPYYATSMIFYEDLAFDGAALQTHFKPADAFTPFATIGAYPIFNSALNVSSNQPEKTGSENKWLYAAQLGATATVAKDIVVKGAGAFYYFDNIAGRASDPFIPLTTSDSGDTDETRPPFAQMGNTYFPIRTIIPSPLNDYGTIDQFQYYGLATPFEDVAATGEVSYNHFEPFRVALAAEFVDNIAFNRSSIAAKAINNLGAGGLGDYVGGNRGYDLELKLGNPALVKRWDWNGSIGYRYLESDAVVDGLDDPDFGVGGTNLKGYFIKGSVSLTPRVWVSLRWFSATSIAGPLYQNDTVQFDFNGNF